MIRPNPMENMKALRAQADAQSKAAADAARAALSMDKGPERDKALAKAFVHLMVCMGMGYHPDGFDASEIIYSHADSDRVWSDDADAEAVTKAHDEATDIEGLDPYDAFTHAHVIYDLSTGDDVHDPETYAWHLKRVADMVDVLAPGYEAIPAATLNKAEAVAGTDITYVGPWIFHPKGDGGDTDPKLEGEFWETLCKLIP